MNPNTHEKELLSVESKAKMEMKETAKAFNPFSVFFSSSQFFILFYSCFVFPFFVTDNFQ